MSQTSRHSRTRGNPFFSSLTKSTWIPACAGMTCCLSMLLLTLSLSACSWSNFPFLYKPDVQQGNVLPEDRVAQLKVGMNRDEVNYLLGTPILVNIINPQETQYIYTLKKGKGEMSEQKLVLIFVGDKLTTIEK